MIEVKATIKNEAGIHCRPTALIIQEAVVCDAVIITVVAPSGSCQLGSALDLMMLGMEHGTEITLQVDGPDEASVAARFKELFETNFGFPDAQVV